MQTILLIEDEAAIADTVIYALETEGFICHWCALDLTPVLLKTPFIQRALIYVIIAFLDTRVRFHVRRHQRQNTVFGLQL